MRILIADDDTNTRLTLRALLQKQDCDIIEAESGMQVLDMIQSDDPPDLIFMNWDMPDLSGGEVTTLLRETQQDYQPYVIIVSAHNDTEQIIQALSYGADDYIAMPVDGHFVSAKFAVAKRIIDMQEKLKQSNQVLEKLAYYDELTGVLNRRAGNASFMVEMERCIRKDHNICIALVDIDHFKSVNDTHGHQAGDQVLRAFAATLQNTVRPYDIVCRYGGEEFLLIAEIMSVTDARELFERVRTSISKTVIKYQGLSLTMTASFGVYVVTPSTDLHLKDLIYKADQALYRAKAEGRNRVIIRADLDQPHSDQTLP